MPRHQRCDEERARRRKASGRRTRVVRALDDGALELGAQRRSVAPLRACGDLCWEIGSAACGVDGNGDFQRV